MSSFESAGKHWRVINALLILSFVAVELLPGTPVEFDTPMVGLVACITAIVGLPLTTIAWLYSSKSDFKMPAWDRSPFRSDDPLQKGFIVTWCAFAAFVAGVVHTLRVGERYFPTVAALGCVFVALLLSKFVAYRVFRRRLKPA